jgi:hypothetical protein
MKDLFQKKINLKSLIFLGVHLFLFFNFFLDLYQVKPVQNW